jgi:hypothetical protein
MCPFGHPVCPTEHSWKADTLCRIVRWVCLSNRLETLLQQKAFLEHSSRSSFVTAEVLTTSRPRWNEAPVTFIPSSTASVLQLLPPAASLFGRSSEPLTHVPSSGPDALHRERWTFGTWDCPQATAPLRLAVHRDLDPYAARPPDRHPDCRLFANGNQRWPHGHGCHPRYLVAVQAEESGADVLRPDAYNAIINAALTASLGRAGRIVMIGANQVPLALSAADLVNAEWHADAKLWDRYLYLTPVSFEETLALNEATPRSTGIRLFNPRRILDEVAIQYRSAPN